MKNKSSAIEPTKSELEILQVLWHTGPATVRAVHTELEKQRDINYTTTLKLMQIMTEKGLLKRDESQMKHVYAVVEDEHKTKSHLLQKFVDSMYKGSASQLVMQLLGNRKTSSQEIQEIRDLLKKLDK